MFGIGAVPLALIGLTGAAWYAQSKRSARLADPKTMAERRYIYETAINNPLEPAKLRELAEAFRKVGMKPEADMLDKRAALREAPKELTEKRREAYHKALRSDNIPAILEMAQAFDDLGATGAAASLRTYAAELQSSKEKEAAQ